jgi:hypothetical protein
VKASLTGPVAAPGIMPWQPAMRLIADELPFPVRVVGEAPPAATTPAPGRKPPPRRADGRLTGGFDAYHWLWGKWARCEIYRLCGLPPAKVTITTV